MEQRLRRPAARNAATTWYSTCDDRTGLIGLLLGVLGGPFGILIGGWIGLLIGSPFDLDDSEDTESILAEPAKSAGPSCWRRSPSRAPTSSTPPWRRSAESSRGPARRRRGGDRRGRGTETQARRAARKTLHEQRRSQAKKKVDGKLSELRTKLRHRGAAAAG